MKNSIIEDYKQHKREAKAFYNTIGRIWSPTLKDYIVFNSAGFRHLVWKGHERRPHIHQIKRFALLPYASKAIMDSSARPERRKKKEYSDAKRSEKNTKAVDTRFWAFRTIVEEKSIRVIVRQRGNGQKHFFSIFEEEKRQQKMAHE